MSLLLHRPVSNLLGCAYPVVPAGMSGVARSELVGAAAFGFLGMVREPVALIRTEVQRLPARGIERFGVNIIPAAPDPALLEAMALYAGEGVGRIKAITKAGERVRAIVCEASALLDTATRRSEDPAHRYLTPMRPTRAK